MMPALPEIAMLLRALLVWLAGSNHYINIMINDASST